jgi:hypothetical protein
MNFRERELYHQIHPVKLVTDGVTAIGAAALRKAFARAGPGAGTE